ncbi:MAG TPA: pectate lyase [Allosphingosinicella sp.]|nr:pectate lyase [Allosphingosinicella sp.]
MFLKAVLFLALALFPAAAAAQNPAVGAAFPGAQGWAAQTPGGRGGRILRVTNLNPAGPGSFRAALEARGPRIVVFEVGGVIDMGLTTWTIQEPFLTIAGQTAPSPGITLIRGGIDIRTHDVIVRHIRIRTGVSGQGLRSGWEADSLSTVGAWNVIVDHCTMTWALDENLSASGPRFTGSTPEEWRRGTSHNITFSYNLLAEGIANASHPKGEHSKGSLIHDNATGILIWRNIYAHNYERSPLLKGGVHAAIVNNLIFNPGAQAIHYNLMDLEWGDHPHQLGELSAVGNVLRAGLSTRADIAFLTIGGVGDLRYHGRDNLAVDRQGRPVPMFGRYTTSSARIVPVNRPLVWPAGLPVLPAGQVETHVLRFAGARPWDRDAHDIRVIFDVVEGRGEIIDNETQVGGYLRVEPTRAPFVEAEWDLATMEPRSGRYPGQRADYVQQPTTARDGEMRR